MIIKKLGTMPANPQRTDKVAPQLLPFSKIHALMAALRNALANVCSDFFITRRHEDNKCAKRLLIKDFAPPIISKLGTLPFLRVFVSSCDKIFSTPFRSINAPWQAIFYGAPTQSMHPEPVQINHTKPHPRSTPARLHAARHIPPGEYQSRGL